jgi:hypothetical protein
MVRYSDIEFHEDQWALEDLSRCCSTGDGAHPRGQRRPPRMSRMQSPWHTSAMTVPGHPTQATPGVGLSHVPAREGCQQLRPRLSG